jgi:hypothetical protein
VVPESSQENTDKCIPVFSIDGVILPGTGRILADLGDISDSEAKQSPAMALARFQQYLSPHFLAARAFHLWLRQDDGRPIAIPANDLDEEKTVITRLLTGSMVREWGMVKDAHICYRLILLWAKLTTRAMARLPISIGDRALRAKRHALR